MKKIIFIFILKFFVNFKLENETIDIEHSLKYEQKIKREWELKHKLDTILTVISYIESRNDSTKFNLDENAAGLLQIRPIMVKEVNQILGYKKYSLKDRWSKQKSIEMFIIYQNFINPEYNEELAARYWNGGRNGDKKQTTDRYVDLYYKYKDVIYDKSTLITKK